jgi:hypothetical protein
MAHKFDAVKLSLSLPLLLIAFSLSFAQRWEPVPLVKKSTLDSGYHPGGEGGQWPQGISIDSVDGSFLLFGTDVGGIYRSLDGGKRWEPANVGYTPRGNSGFAIDPNNSNFCIAVGANSSAWGWHGLYLSENKGASWKSVLSLNYDGYRDHRDQVAFDKSSLQNGRSRIAYYSSLKSGLYKSMDGGQSWKQIQSGYSNSHLKVHLSRGFLYLGNSQGFYRSTDGGVSLQRTFEGNVQGVDVSQSAPDAVYINTSDGIWRSTNSGESFTKLTASGLPTSNLRHIKVSPVNSNRQVIWYQGSNWDWRRYYSSDGGSSWKQSTFNNNNAFLPYNSRQAIFAWHPKDQNIVWSFGADWITRSTNAGATWDWAGNGYNAVFITSFNFNLQNPDILFIASQDYNAALTTDGGRTWNYKNMSGLGWGGYCYGGYAASGSVVYGGNSDSWGGTRRLKVSRDGGSSFTDTGTVLSGANVSYGHPTDTNVLFAFDHRSTDQGHKWSKMSGCDGVLTSNPVGGRELYGRNGSNLVKSTDKGATWSVITNAGSNINDVAFDHARGHIYVVSGDRLRRWDGSSLVALNTPTDQMGNIRIKSVAVDPTNPDVVYAAGSKDIYSTSVASIRSVDGGNSWTVLTLNSPLSGNVDGGREAVWVRVHPKSRYAYFATSCYGIWKIGPPGSTPSPTPDPKPTATPTPDPESVASIISTSVGPVIDGKLDAIWSNAPGYNISKTVSGTVSSSSDLAGSYRAMWDTEKLYILVSVSDEKPVNDSASIWDDDGVEIYLDGDNSKSSGYDNVNDLQYIFDGSTVVETKLNRTNGVTFVRSDLSDGYVVEASIPWSVIGVAAGSKAKIGIDIHINDDDDNGSRDGKLAWSSSDDTVWADPSRMGTGILETEVPLPPAQTFSFDLDLIEGWNLISLPLQTVDRKIESVLSNIVGKFEVVYAWNGSEYEAYVADKTIVSGQPKLLTMEPGRGYWIYMNEKAKLRITGTVFVAGTGLKSGWNLSGYSSRLSMKVDKALASINGNYLVVYGYDTKQGGYLTYFPGEIDELKNMEPGRGYWIYMTKDVIWRLP